MIGTPSYCERFELYATANELTSEEKRLTCTVFLSVCGAPTHELIRSLSKLARGESTGTAAAAVKLRTFTGERLPVCGQITVKVSYKDEEAQLVLVVIKGNGPTSMGRSWFEKLHIQWLGGAVIHHISNNTGDLKTVLTRHKELFADALRLVKGVKERPEEHYPTVFQTKVPT